jgi:hypothetical protein
MVAAAPVAAAASETAELKDAAGPSSAGVAQNLRRMLDRVEVGEKALPRGATGYRLADDRNRPSARGHEDETGW